MEKLLLKSDEMAERLGIGRTLFYRMHASGELGPLPIKLGTCSLWSTKEFDAWVDARCPARERWQQMLKSQTDRQMEVSI